jgi:EmrB/QacA subfamily drug resistance transporter
VTTSTSAPAKGPLTHRQIMVILSGLLLGMFLAALDQTIVSTAMRTIADKLHGQTAQAWVTTAYLITSTITTPLYGKLSDMYGRKPFYLFAIGIFITGSILCGTAQSIYMLAVWRAVQGIGAGGLMSLAFAIVGDIVPPRERGRYQAYFMSVFASSSVLGPVLGGALAGQSSILGFDGWRWVFYVNVPIGLVAFAVVFTRLNLPRRRTDHRVDYIGAVLLTLAVVPLLVVAEKGREWGWGSGTSLTLIALTVIGLVGFIPWERRMGEEAILPLRVFQSGVFTLSSIVSLLIGAAMFGGIVVLPLFLQIVRGSSPTVAGLQTLPLMVGIILASATSGRIMMRTGRYKVFPVVGTAVLFVAMVLLHFRLQVETPLWQIQLSMAVLGVGLGLCMQTLVISVQNALPPRDMGVATSSVTFFRSMGGTFGAAISLAVLFGSLVHHIQVRLLAAGVPADVVAGFGNASSFDDTSGIAKLSPVIKAAVLHGFADSAQSVFLVVAALLVPAFVLTLFIKEVPLRSQGGIAAAAAADGATVEQTARTTETETAVV